MNQDTSTITKSRISISLSVGANLGVFAGNEFTQLHNLVVDAQSISLLDGIVC